MKKRFYIAVFASVLIISMVACANSNVSANADGKVDQAKFEAAAAKFDSAPQYEANEVITRAVGAQRAQTQLVQLAHLHTITENGAYEQAFPYLKKSYQLAWVEPWTREGKVRDAAILLIDKIKSFEQAKNLISFIYPADTPEHEEAHSRVVEKMVAYTENVSVSNLTQQRAKCFMWRDVSEVAHYVSKEKKETISRNTKETCKPFFSR